MNESWQLEWCGIYRDGGSLGAVVSCGNSKQALFLEIGSWDHPADPKHYENLWVSAGEVPNPHGEKVGPRSATEREWLKRLRSVNLPAERTDREREIFSSLISSLNERNS